MFTPSKILSYVLATCFIMLTSCEESSNESQTPEKEKPLSHSSINKKNPENSPTPPSTQGISNNPDQIMSGPPPRAVSETSNSEQTIEQETDLTKTKNVPFILKDLSQIKIRPNTPTPKLGDTIYTMENLPEDACGEYWILEKDGTVNMLAICTHPEGEHETKPPEN